MRWLALLALAGCASFEDPQIVLDLRVIAAEATPPEQVLDLDPTRPPTVDELLAQLQPVKIRALVAQPDRAHELLWTMTACVLDDDGSRCDPDGPSYEIAGGELQDPEVFPIGAPCRGERAEDAGTVCGLLEPDARLVGVLAAVVEDDPSGGLAGIDLGVVLRVRDVYADPPIEAFAAKHVRFAPRVPVDRRPNTNPHIDQVLIGRGGFGTQIGAAPCAEGPNHTVGSDERVTLFPVSRDEDKELYVLPTLDGQAAYFTEYLTYQWIATAGSFTDELTGGPPDVFGNVKLEGTQWRAPEVTADTNVSVWIVQRDSRYGVRWWEGCIEVVPP